MNTSLDNNFKQGMIQEKSINGNLNEGNLPSHQEFTCAHGCNQFFKSNRQKLLHHDKLDFICHEEKSNLINLIENFNLVINKLLPYENQKKKYKEYYQLIKQYKRTKKLSKDPLQFETLIQLK